MQPPDLSPKLELATKARIDWAIHLHSEIHNYVRSGFLIMQLVVTAAAATVALIFRTHAAQRPALLAAPYLVGVTFLLWTEYTREIMVGAGVIEHLEERVEDALGTPALLHERLLAGSPIGGLTAKVNNCLAIGAYAITVSIAIDHSLSLALEWVILNAAALALLTLSILLAALDTYRARGRARAGADELDPPSAV